MKIFFACKFSKIDKIYHIEHDYANGYLRYVGISKSVISYDFELNYWIINDMANPYLWAASEAAFRTLAIGKKSWHVHNDTECSQENYQTNLTLTSCSANEFSCDDGWCIATDKR